MTFGGRDRRGCADQNASGQKNRDANGQQPSQECLAELKKSSTSKEGDEAAAPLVASSKPELEACIKLSDYSNGEKLFRITALVLRFIKNLKIKKERSMAEPVHKTDITEAEVETAEAQWLRTGSGHRKGPHAWPRGPKEPALPGSHHGRNPSV